MKPTDLDTSSSSESKLKSTGLSLPSGQDEYDERKRALNELMMSKLSDFGILNDSHVNEQDDQMPKTYKEHKERLDQEERMGFDYYKDDLDSQEYIYDSDF